MGLNWTQTRVSHGSKRQPERRYLVLHVPYWATDCFKRHDRTLAESTQPLVLYEKQKSALNIVAVDALAEKAGLSSDLNLAQARAAVPGLQAREIDRPFLEAAFADFADWLSFASPVVAVLPDVTAFGDLGFDVTGVTHLFGGEQAMLAEVLKRLGHIGILAQGAISSSIGASWALARYAPSTIATHEQTLEGSVLADLPIGALRLEREQISSLSQLGLRRIGQVLDYERLHLQARLGESFIRRLDQARGRVSEQIRPRIPVAEHFVERRFAEPLGLLDDVLLVTTDLALRLASELEMAGLGARSFHLMIYRVDYKLMCLSVNAARATREASHIDRLFRNRAERLSGEFDAGFGIEMVRLAATELSPLQSSQTSVFAEDDGTGDLHRLYDRMSSRLGSQAVLRTVWVNTHIPEKAAGLAPVVTAPETLSFPGEEEPRPIRLLPAPEPIKVTAEVPDGPPASMVWRRILYRFVKASGPERIGEEWWLDEFELSERRLLPPRPEDRRKPASEKPRIEILRHIIPSRDYYVAEDDGGRRFWLFRQGLYGEEPNPQWFMHGFLP
ncbi:hypothetical protein GCM10011321_36210 [Youhaiella tibetensis]|uniref:DNA polymerase Y family protein n=1 Tax=Paradevosia tibetensis TaxID=1447062 RepID=A0A5B9DTD8_9HYPH|nr:DNA polymerase Y family protein [Youhaiella tibetensis]GGF42361.1 hypothetical protein GCM10011321_36210 [Youhaiella tibetensis]